MYDLFTKEAEAQGLADEPSEDEIDDRNNKQRDECIERAGTDEVAGTREVGDGNITHDRGILQQRDTFACVERQTFAQRLREDDAHEGLEGRETETQSGFGLSFGHR